MDRSGQNGQNWTKQTKLEKIEKFETNGQNWKKPGLNWTKLKGLKNQTKQDKKDKIG